MIYYDEERRIGTEDVIIKRARRIRDIGLKDAFKLFVISKFLEKPVAILVRERTPGIRYRYGLPVLDERRLKNIESSVIIFKGGVYYKINPGKLLRKLRELGISLGEFCRKLGISRRNFYNYLKGQMVQEEHYQKMEELLGNIREDKTSRILEVREYKFRIEISEEISRAYNILRERFKAYILNNDYVDLCVKAKKRIVIKIGKENDIEKAAKELKSEPVVVEKPEEVRIIMMNY